MATFDISSPHVFVSFGALTVCFVFTGVFLWLNKDAGLKRKLFPYLAGGLGVLVLATIVAVGIPAKNLLVFGPMVAVAVWLNIRGFQFCQACGETDRGAAYFSRSRFCKKCGAPL